jgi:hypothetical protein
MLRWRASLPFFHDVKNSNLSKPCFSSEKKKTGTPHPLPRWEQQRRWRDRDVFLRRLGRIRRRVGPAQPLARERREEQLADLDLCCRRGGAREEGDEAAAAAALASPADRRRRRRRRRGGKGSREAEATRRERRAPLPLVAPSDQRRRRRRPRKGGRCRSPSSGPGSPPPALDAG